MLKSLTIDGYRSFRHAQIDLEPLTVLVGPNGAGKTSLAYALETLAHLLHEPLHGGSREFRPSGLPFEQLCFGLPSSGGRWRFGAAFEDDEAWGDYHVEVARVGPLCVTEERLAYHRRGAGQPVVMPQPGVDYIPLLGAALQWPWEQTLPVRLRGVLQTAKVTPELDAVRWLSRQLPWSERFAPDPSLLRQSDQAADSTTSVGHNGAGFPAALRRIRDRAGSRFPAIVQRVRTVADFVEDVGFNVQNGKVRVELKVRGVDDPLPAEAISDGTLLVLFLAWLAESHAPGGVAVLEELDHSVHPYVVPILLDWLDGLATGSPPTQVILTTHSPLLVNVACGGKPERLRIVERTDADGTSFRKLVPASNDELARALEVYRDAPGSLWYSGNIGGTPSVSVKSD